MGIYNAESGVVVEAEGKGVHRTPLLQFISKSYRLLIIRPRWHSDENGQAAMEEALKLAGRSYDFLGTVGFNYPDKYYCSELAVSVYGKFFTAKEKFPLVIKPGELYLFGTVLYDSLPRDEM